MPSYSDFPQEIIFNILSRVPAKSVGLFRCVSNPCRALLSQPNFIKIHLQLAKINSLESLLIIGYPEHGSVIYVAPLNNSHHLLQEVTLSLTKLSFSGYDPDTTYRIYGSCDGLLLLLFGYDNLLVMNPVTRETRNVPRLSRLRALDHCETHLLYGFGYDSVRDDYKIVIISFCGKHVRVVADEVFVDIYSLKAGYWRRLECCPNDYVGSPRNSSAFAGAAFAGGCLHWLTCRTTDNTYVIVAYNLDDNNFLEVPTPSMILDCSKANYKLVLLRCCLCLYNVNDDCEVWVMEEYGVPESWTKFMVNNPRCRFECFISDQEQVVMREKRTDNSVMWNIKQGTSKEIVFGEFNDDPYSTLRVEASFVESLVSPHGCNKSERA